MRKKEKKRFRMKKRFILLCTAVLLMLMLAVKYIDIAGDCYELRAGIIADEEAIGGVSVSFETEGIVSAERIYCSDDGEVTVSLRSEHVGVTNMTLKMTAEELETPIIRQTKLEVSNIGTIIEKNELYTNFSGYQLVIALFLTMMALTLGVMLFSYCECWKKSSYSYSMVAYGGVALYLFELLAIIIYKLLNNVVNSFSDLVFQIMQTGRWFVSLLFPVMLLMAVALSVSNIRLLRHEGFRPVNALGIGFSCVWLFGLALTLNDGIFGLSIFENSVVWGNIRFALTYIITYFECMLISASVSAFLAARHTPPYDRDYIIILGCAIRRDGSLTPLLKGRADAALRFEQRQYEATGKRACFVPSGGQGSDEIISEGEAMERYLLSQGIEPGYIRREDKSTNTFENMAFSKETIERCCEDFSRVKIAFSTTNYHVFRGYILSKKNGFAAQGISAQTKWYFFPNAFIREFIGLLADQFIRHIGIISLMLLILTGIMAITL